MAQAMASRQFVTRMPSIVYGLLQSFRIHAGLNAQTIQSLRESVNPRVDVLRHLVVTHADHALARGIQFGIAQQAHQLVGGSRTLVKLAIRVEPLELPHQAGFPDMHAEFASSRGIHPSAVHVGA